MRERDREFIRNDTPRVYGANSHDGAKSTQEPEPHQRQYQNYHHEQQQQQHQQLHGMLQDGNADDSLFQDQVPDHPFPPFCSICARSIILTSCPARI
jgi:hypothetical protein